MGNKLDVLREKLMTSTDQDLDDGLEMTREFCESSLASIDRLAAKTGIVHPSRGKVAELLKLVERLEKSQREKEEKSNG